MPELGGTTDVTQAISPPKLIMPPITSLEKWDANSATRQAHYPTRSLFYWSKLFYVKPKPVSFQLTTTESPTTTQGGTPFSKCCLLQQSALHTRRCHWASFFCWSLCPFLVLQGVDQSCFRMCKTPSKERSWNTSENRPEFRPPAGLSLVHLIWLAWNISLLVGFL